MALSEYVQRQCAGNDSQFCKFATSDISWIALPIIALMLIIAMFIYVKNRKQQNLMQKKAKENNITLDTRAQSVYEAIKELGTTDPEEIVVLGNRPENAPMWIAGLNNDRVTNIITQLKSIGYLSSDGRPTT